MVSWVGYSVGGDSRKQEVRRNVNCRVFYHDKCFDGACSAAMFTRFHTECAEATDGSAWKYAYQGLVHRAGSLFEEAGLRRGGRMRLWTSSTRLRRS